HNTLNTEFVWMDENPLKQDGKLEHIIQELCHKNSIDYTTNRGINTKLWYPDDLLDFIKQSSPEQYRRFIKYLTKGN
ncbi:hypothetical protein LCGC14_1394970, partial [marine sediment metagenome]